MGGCCRHATRAATRWSPVWRWSGRALVWLGAYPLLSLPYTCRRCYLPPMVVAAAGLALRRRAPLVALAIGTVAMTGDVALGGSLATLVIFTQVLYEACLYGPRSTWRWLLRVTVAVTAVAAAATFWPPGLRAAGSVAVVGVLLLVFPVVTGLSVRQYRDQAEAERARAEQTARLAELDRAQAVTAERHRMARELHDVVANHLSAVAIHATAAQAARPGPARGTAALAVIRDSSVQRAGRDAAADPAAAGLRPAVTPAPGWPSRCAPTPGSPRSTGWWRR